MPHAILNTACKKLPQFLILNAIFDTIPQAITITNYTVPPYSIIYTQCNANVYGIPSHCN